MFSAGLEQQILLDIAGKLISAPCQLAEYAVCALIAFVPIVFGDVIAMDRTDLYLDIRKRHLIQHKTAPCMKCFTDDNRRTDFNTLFISSLSGKKGIVACMPRFVLANDHIGRHTVFDEHIRKEFTIGSVIAVIYVCFRFYTGSFIVFYTDSS